MCRTSWLLFLISPSLFSFFTWMVASRRFAGKCVQDSGLGYPGDLDGREVVRETKVVFGSLVRNFSLFRLCVYEMPSLSKVDSTKAMKNGVGARIR